MKYLNEKEWNKLSEAFIAFFCDHFESTYSRQFQWTIEEYKPAPYPEEILSFFENRLTEPPPEYKIKIDEFWNE